MPKHPIRGMSGYGMRAGAGKADLDQPAADVCFLTSADTGHV